MATKATARVSRKKNIFRYTAAEGAEGIYVGMKNSSFIVMQLFFPWVGWRLHEREKNGNLERSFEKEKLQHFRFGTKFEILVCWSLAPLLCYWFESLGDKLSSRFILPVKCMGKTEASGLAEAEEQETLNNDLTFFDLIAWTNLVELRRLRHTKIDSVTQSSQQSLVIFLGRCKKFKALGVDERALDSFRSSKRATQAIESRNTRPEIDILASWICDGFTRLKLEAQLLEALGWCLLGRWSVGQWLSMIRSCTKIQTFSFNHRSFNFH